MQKYIFNIHDVILLMTVAVCIQLVIFQAILPVKNQIANRLLSVFLLSIAINSACTLILWNDDLRLFNLFDETMLPYLLVIAQLLKGLTLYFYVVSLTEGVSKFARHHLLHLVPLTIAIFWLLIFQIDSSDLRFKNSDQTETERQIANSVWYFIKIIPFFYALAAVNSMRLYRGGLQNQYSNFSSSEPTWLNILSLGFLFTWGFSVLTHVIANRFALNTPQITDLFGITENYIIFILINALFIDSAANTHRLFTTKPEATKDKVDEKPTDSAIQKVQLGMEVQKLFLKQNLNIDEFSKRINLPVKEVSAVINKHYGTNFFEFMNSYRVEEAKRLLGAPENADMTVMDVLLQSGFNSKSAFHRFFNRLVGMSPTEFRKKHAFGKTE